MKQSNLIWNDSFKRKMRAKMPFLVVNWWIFAPNLNLTEKFSNFFFGLSVVNWVLIYAKPPFKLKFLGRKAKTAPPP